MSIALQINKIKESIPENVLLVAVSKTHGAKQVMEAYEAGQLAFGENKAQELIAKQPLLPADIRWHFIGHLQTNKVKYLAPFVSMIESVDSLKLLKEVNKQAAKNKRVIDVLLQFHIAEEDTKFGLDMEEAKALLESETYSSFNHIRLCGVMGMATFTEDKTQVKREFKHLKSIFDSLKSSYFANIESFKEISMGMSGDYKEAIEEGASIVRIGSLIFGERDYTS
jgi:PLP dependent protein